MSSDLPDDLDLKIVFAQLLAREPIFHRPLSGLTVADAEKLMVSDYWEIGASGQRYDRALVLDEMSRREAQPVDDAAWLVSQSECRRLSQDTFLFTYRLEQGDRVTQRATIWIRSGDDWRIVYHQGTIVMAP